MTDHEIVAEGARIDAERIQSLREWCERGHYDPDSPDDWQRGFLDARREVRAILDGVDQ